jgi:hypothetical protein
MFYFVKMELTIASHRFAAWLTVVMRSGTIIYRKPATRIENAPGECCS